MRPPAFSKLPNAMHGKARKSVQKKKSSERPANLARMLQINIRAKFAGRSEDFFFCTDFFLSSEISAEEEIFGAACKFGSYVDLLFSAEELRFLFPANERLVQRLTQLLKRVPEIPAAAEFLIRRCYFHQGTETREGFYITFYLFGYADDQEHAQNQWTIGLKLVENANRQISASWKFTR